MAKTKNVVNGKDDGSKSQIKDKKSTNFKPSPFTTTTPEVMVMAALQSFAENGGNLTKIRGYIVKNYNNGKRLTKSRQTQIKDYIKEKFEKGDIQMTNSDAESINFNMCFALGESKK